MFTNFTFVYLQYASRDKLHRYVQIAFDKLKIILIKVAINNAEKVDKYPSNVQIVKS